MDADRQGHAERRQGEALLGELRITTSTILEGLPDAVVATAGDGRIVFVNALAEELFGYTRHELLGQPVEMLWPERLRDSYTRYMQRTFATGHPLRFTSE